MNEIYEKLLKCYDIVQKKVNFKPEIALVLGSGLGNFADEIDVTYELDYHDIDGFPVSTAPTHEGKFIFGYINEIPIVCMKGRIHYYEGYSVSDAVLPIRLLKLMGAKVLFLTNASGGINTSFQIGDFMLIRDHIANFVPSPLIGPNIDELGVRFPDMSNIYKDELCKIVLKVSKEINIHVQQGTYIQLTGPNYETPAEIKMCKMLGADAVGMSTAIEAIAANHCGLNCVGISCISNMASGISKNPLSEEEVTETGKMVAPKFKELVKKSIIAIHENYINK
ncbi:MAG: purine-nucleoside phosphorylase [Lachnospiraceae bacterium]|nr:purine-nucleoside phosphorylase [Lachnospiraceae bacterium]